MINRVAFEGPVKTSGGGGKQGGGKTGALVGAALGGVSGGLAGAGAGAGLGAMVGEALSPSEAGQAAMSRRIETMQPQPVLSETSEKLKQSVMALHAAPQPVRDEYGPQLIQAYLTSLSNDRRG